MINLDYTGLPEGLRVGMCRYIEGGILPGSFLKAVLANDLMNACAHADHVNRQRLFDIVDWLYNEAPGNCWGSPEKMQVWIDGAWIPETVIADDDPNTLPCGCSRQ